MMDPAAGAYGLEAGDIRKMGFAWPFRNRCGRLQEACGFSRGVRPRRALFLLLQGAGRVGIIPFRRFAVKIVTSIVVFSTILSATAPAKSAGTPPQLYRVEGRPVPVSCLEELAGMDGDSRKARIDLRSCGDSQRKPKAQSDGSIGYENADGGYFYYTYVGRVGSTDILSLQSSGGGSGHFTALVGVQHSGHFVRRVRDYAGGDRCNGGISNARITNGKLAFDQAITPYDLVSLAPLKTRLAAYKDLEASAASCIGVVHRTGDGGQWTGVRLTAPDWSDHAGWTEQYRYQSCFNTLYGEAVSRGQVELDRRGVAAFADAFSRRCLKTG